MTRASLQITNTGYRLLRTNVRVEPSSASWIKVPDEFARGPVVTVDQTDLPLEVHIPETFDTSTHATLLLDSNGGTRRVEVRLERPAAPDAIPEPIATTAGYAGLGLHDLIARQPIGLRLVTWSAGTLLLRLLVLVAGRLPFSGATAGAGTDSTLFLNVAALLAVVGCGAAMAFALKRGEPRDVPTSGFAGGFAGVLAAALLVAACRTIEPLLGTRLAASPIAVCLLWGLLGAALAAVSGWLAPPTRPVAEESS